MQMQFYWKCEECDEINEYPNVKICETCGSPMTPAAEQRVLHEIKEEEKRQVQIKKKEERRRREAERAKQEAERKRQEALKIAQQAEEERKRIKQREKKLKQKEAKEKKLAFVLRKCANFSSGFMRTLAVLAVGLTVLIFIQNADDINFDNAFKRVSDNFHTEYLAHTVIKSNNTVQETENDDGSEPSNEDLDVDKERNSRVQSKVGLQFSLIFEGVSSNIEKQFYYLKETFNPIANISALIEDIVEYISGGVV